MKEIRTESIVKQYKGRTVVKGASLHVSEGEVIGLLGPNGAGKTTTFYMIVGLVRPNSGKVYLNGKDVTVLPMYKRARLGLGYLPQEPSIFKKLTVEDNLRLLLEVVEPIPPDQFESRINELIMDLGLNHVRKSKGYQLSGGEKRRVEIARSLSLNPSFILLDEPFAGVDPIAVNEIQGIIKSLKDKGIGIIITDHNVRETLAITDRSYIIHEGEILLSGNPNEIANSDIAKKYYLGESFELA
ncbi:LPS export ABC transporter ATP-binding protein [Candidatus Marinamargulisbacteria bacterium SCGC AG-343-K17]|nr:LPS export ABC transporter ATP-binding protein [Candidatus Marinamargulisbacteria bacterium SCGC AG-343-K17]